MKVWFMDGVGIDHGQIGCGKELGENISVITQLKTLKKIKSIHCSFFIVICIDRQWNGL